MFYVVTAHAGLESDLTAPGNEDVSGSTREHILNSQFSIRKGVSDGGDLLSHTVAHAVPSAQAGLTSVFGMGTGVAPLL